MGKAGDPVVVGIRRFVESMPALRQPPGTERPVSFDDIMDALRRLDAAAPLPDGSGDEDHRQLVDRLSA